MPQHGRSLGRRPRRVAVVEVDHRQPRSTERGTVPLDPSLGGERTDGRAESSRQRPADRREDVGPEAGGVRILGLEGQPAKPGSGPLRGYPGLQRHRLSVSRESRQQRQRTPYPLVDEPMQSRSHHQGDEAREVERVSCGLSKRGRLSASSPKRGNPPCLREEVTRPFCSHQLTAATPPRPLLSSPLRPSITPGR